MSPIVTPQSFEFSASLPGKVFLVGEYAVMSGEPALVAALGPRFVLRAQATGNPEEPAFVEQSPAGRLLSWARKQGLPELDLKFADPYHGQGGFGASSAQFALTYFAYAQVADLDRRWQSVWKLYRELTRSEISQHLSPSGADVVSQWRGGVVFFDPSDQFCLDVWPIFDWSGLLVFSATQVPGRKTATHHHLAELSPARLEQVTRELRDPIVRAGSAVREGDGAAFGRALTDYAETLSHLGLEANAAREDRLALSQFGDVLGAKGCGAALSDSVIVLLKPRSPQRQDIIRVAEARGLKLVADGLQPQMGVQAER